MATRYKTFESTGLAPLGRLYPGDLNAIQDMMAAITDFAQVLSLGTLQVGDAGIALTKSGTGEAQLSSALRVTGILRGLGGVVIPSMTTVARDALASGSRPSGMLIYNTTTLRVEINRGSDATPEWRQVGGLSAAAKLYRTSNSAVNDNSLTDLPFTSELFDQDAAPSTSGMWVVGSPSVVTIQEPGLYRAKGFIQWELNAAGTYRYGAIRWNGSIQSQVWVPPSATIYPCCEVEAIMQCAAGNTIALAGKQDSGSARNVIGGVDNGGLANTHLEVTRIGD